MRLIDADTLIPMMKYATTDSEIGVFPIKIGFNDIVKVINAQPTIKERKKGKWINEGIYGEGHSECSIRCSNCDWHYIGYLDDYNFCPNCGVDMRGEI